MWENVVTAVVTAVAVTAIAESARAIRRHLDRRGLAAAWTLRGYPAISGMSSRFFVIENVGDADALDVHVTLAGNANYEVNAGAELNILRPSDTFLLLVHTPGTGSVNIAWKDRKGKSHGPVRRALTPE